MTVIPSQNPVRVEHLIGIPYESGSNDCYGLVRRFFSDNFDLELPDFARPEEWWVRRPELNLLVNSFPAAGFDLIHERKERLRIGDCPLMAIGTQVISHCGVIFAPGRLLHLPFGRVSRDDLYGGVWANRTMMVIRHRSVPDVQGAGVRNLMDIIPAHKRKRYLAAIN